MSRTNQTTLETADSILLLGAERVGDMLFATPAIRMLRDYKPDARIDILVFSALSREVMSYNPAIDDILVSPGRREMKRFADRYDICVAVHESREIRKIAPYLPNVKMYNRDAAKPMHMKMFPIAFVRELLNRPGLPFPESYQLFPQPEHFESVEKLLLDNGADLEKDSLICCHMGCRRVAKRGARWFKSKNVAGDTKSWEFSRYEELARRLETERPEIKLVLTGTRGEQRIAREYLSGRANTIDLIGQTSILQLAALMKYCDRFLSANTGPLHIACATPIPLVTLTGKHDPAVYGPSPESAHRIVLRNQGSVDNITVDEVQAALLSL